MDSYNKKMMRKQILRVREHSRNDLLERKKPHIPEQILIFNITYYPAFQKKIFPNVSVAGFRNGMSLKNYLVRATLPPS